MSFDPPVPMGHEEALRKMDELRRKYHPKERPAPRRKPSPPKPGGVDELWPGGPGVDTNDIRNA